MAPWHVPFYWRFTGREVRRRPLRSLLALVGIVLGVAAVAAVQLGSDVTRDVYTGLFRTVAGRADLAVVPAGGQGSIPDALEVLQNIPGVRAALPLIQAPAGLVTARGPVPILVLGIDPAHDGAARDYRVLRGSPLTVPRGLFLEAGFAAQHGLDVGRPAGLVTPRGRVEIEVAGLLAAVGPARFNGGAVAVLPLGQAQALFTSPGEVHAVHLVLTPGTDPEEVRKAIESRLPGRVVRAPDSRSELAGEFLASTEQVLRSLSAVAVVAGALVILNTLLMNLGERQRQLALLRALGVTRRQVVGLLVRQALLLGGLGSLLGLLLGILLAALLLRINAHYLAVPLPGVRLSPGPLLLAGVLGLAMPLLATILPARRAAWQAPLDGLRQRGSTAPTPPARWTVLVGAILIAGVLLFQCSVIQGWLPPGRGVAFLPLVLGAGLTGCVGLLPAAVPALLRVVGSVLAPVVGIEGRLAVRQLQRQQARTGLTVGVLFAAVTAVLSFGLSFLNNLRDIDVWYARTIDGTYLVRAVEPDPALVTTTAALPASAAAEIARLPGCAAVARFRFIPTHVASQAALLIAREVPAGTELPLILHQGDAEEVRVALDSGAAVLGSALGAQISVGVGDTVVLPTRGGPRAVPVAGIAKEYAVGGKVLYMDWAQAVRLFGFEQPHGLAVYAAPGEEERLGASLEAYCRKQGLLLQHRREFARVVYRVADGIRATVAGMVVVIFVVAAVGVVNTLTANVLDQTRELGVLRAVGMKRGQLRRLILVQAGVLAGVSCLPGVPAGVLLAYLMNRAMPGLLGHFVPFRVDGWFVLACLAGVVALAVAASALPARRAARLAVIDALRYE